LRADRYLYSKMESFSMQQVILVAGICSVILHVLVMFMIIEMSCAIPAACVVREDMLCVLICCVIMKELFNIDHVV